ncbi:hypothetical protein N7508_008996 [Penicillium antarcticum]|uniref:uncharacterized protein n=1 Tax=Penicillium antarcticum TaxID=416450 RepID=UPI002382F14F|nr:uncharacterized protein N7508_008996 [Penicillium antarcticum]KAJ5294175.1 hypothetical protein N7508_008996 [Penicillium antarcticum]
MSEIQRWTVNEPYLDIPGTLLEGPYHDAANNEFRFVDIWDQKLYRLDLAKDPDSLRVIDTAASVGMRFNDGAVDSHGRFWAGAMNDPKIKNPDAEGVLFRLDPDLSLHRMLTSVTIPNGIGWNAADDTMYLTDSPTGKIFAFDFDATTGAISNRRVHFDIGSSLEPDGFAIDVEGCIWTAVYGGGCVLRIDPAGKVIGQIDLPTRNVTCPTFVGIELFITTAKDDRDDERLPQSVRYGGRLYRVDVGVRGKPKTEFRFQK